MPTAIIVNPYTGQSKFMEDWIDQYVMGSEGGSAWVWLRGECRGVIGDTRKEAVIKLLNILFEEEHEHGKHL